MARTELEEVGRFNRRNASETALYAGEGTSVSKRARARRANADPNYQKSFSEAMTLYKNVLKGDKWAALRFQEAMTTSDFSFLFGDIIDRQMLASYQQMPVQWTALARSGRVRDFRTVKRFTLDGGESILQEVGEQSEYPAASLADNDYEYSVRKFGRRIPLSWETLINDDLDAFADIPRRLGNAARRSEERFATALYAKSTGPDATFFSVANANRTDVQLNVSGLQEAMRMLGEQTDTEGDTIFEQVSLGVNGFGFKNLQFFLGVRPDEKIRVGSELLSQNYGTFFVQFDPHRRFPRITLEGRVGEQIDFGSARDALVPLPSSP